MAGRRGLAEMARLIERDQIFQLFNVHLNFQNSDVRWSFVDAMQNTAAIRYVI